MTYTFVQSQFSTPTKKNKTRQINKLGFGVNSNENKIEYNPITDSPNPKKGSGLASTDFRLEFLVIDTTTHQTILKRIVKIFGPENKITIIRNTTNKQLSFNKTVSIQKKDLIKSNKVSPYLKGKHDSAAKIVEKHIIPKVDYEIKTASCQLLHLIPKIFRGDNIDTQTIDNTFPGIMEANITQRSASEIFTKQLITKNETNTAFYNPKLYICNQKLQGCKNNSKTQIGDLMEMNVSYIPNTNPLITCKMSVQIPTLKTILNLGDKDKAIRKAIRIMIKEINRHYCERSYNNKSGKKRKPNPSPIAQHLNKKRKIETQKHTDINDAEKKPIHRISLKFLKIL